MTIKVVVWGFEKDASEIIRKLKSKQWFELIAWFNDTADCTHNIYDFFWGNFNYSFEEFDQKLYHRISKCYLQFSDMYSRHFLYFEKDYHDYLNIFNRLFYFFSKLIKRNAVDCIIFANIPHEGPDLILYNIAKAFDIKTLMFYQTLFPDRFVSCMNISDFGYFSSTPTLLKRDNKINFNLNRTTNYFYMSNIKDFNFSFISVVFNFIKNGYRSIIYYKKMKKYFTYQKKYTSLTYEIHSKYVYFPLHLQPELTTSALGGIFSDQILAIEILSTLIPPDWYVYVKENPKQNMMQRGHDFYRRLNSITNVRLLAKSENTIKLIKNSVFVATITGTVGWESICLGKNVMVFGSPWYKRLPGVFVYNDGLTIKKILDYKISKKKLETEIQLLMKKTGYGVIDSSYSCIVKSYDKFRNADKVVNYIQRVLLKK